MSGLKTAGASAGARVNEGGWSSYVRPSYHPQDARAQFVDSTLETAAGSPTDPLVDAGMMLFAPKND